jgi:polyisoprenoid-binding protein YceI
MDLADGTYALGNESGQLLIKTSRMGLGARAGHDLTIEVTRWHGELTVDSADVARSSVRVEVDADSFEVRTGTGGLKPLTDGDRAEIKQTVREKILHTRQHPSITFRSTQLAGTAESFSIDGDLTIIGMTRPVTVHGRLTDDGAQGSAVVVQSQWGIRPYTAFFGALKLSDEVTIEFSIRVAPAD